MLKITARNEKLYNSEIKEILEYRKGSKEVSMGKILNEFDCLKDNGMYKKVIKEREETEKKIKGNKGKVSLDFLKEYVSNSKRKDDYKYIKDESEKLLFVKEKEGIKLKTKHEVKKFFKVDDETVDLEILKKQKEYEEKLENELVKVDEKLPATGIWSEEGFKTEKEDKSGLVSGSGGFESEKRMDIDKDKMISSLLNSTDGGDVVAPNQMERMELSKMKEVKKEVKKRKKKKKKANQLFAGLDDDFDKEILLRKKEKKEKEKRMKIEEKNLLNFDF